MLPQTVTRIFTEAELRLIQSNPELEHSNVLGQQADLHAPAIFSPNGCELYFASTQPKKFYELAQGQRFSNADVKVRDAISVLRYFLSADEISQTYTGNAYEKAEALLNRIYDEFGYDNVLAAIKQQGGNPDNAVFAVNDTGSHFNTDYSGEPEFNRSYHEVGRGKWPGVELGPVTDAQGGMPEFFSSLGKMKDRFEAEGRKVDLSGADANQYLFFRLTPDRKDIKIISIYSEVPLEHAVNPRPEKTKDVYTSFHFSHAKNSELSAGDQAKSREELGAEYVGKYSSQAIGFNRFVQLADIPRSSEPAFENAAKRKSGPIVIATHHNALPVDQVRKWLPRAIHHEANINGKKSRVKTNEHGAYQQLTRTSAAVVLGEHSLDITRNYDDHFLDLFDLWCSLHVDKQLRVETFENTPFFVINRHNPFQYGGKEGKDLNWNDPDVEREFLKYLKNINPKKDPWLAFISFNEYLHGKGFIKQEPRFLHTRLDPTDPKFVKVIKDDVEEERGKITYVPNYAREDYGTDRTDLFEVTILGSASTRVEAYTNDAYAFGYWLASNGIHVRDGGGRYGIMGANASGALDYLKNRTSQDSQAHFSAIQTFKTAQFEGISLKSKELEDVSDKALFIEPSFDTRMSNLLRSDVIVAQAPGIGTYQEITRFVRLKEQGYEPFQNKTMILVNQEQAAGSYHIRLMDPLFAIMPWHLIENHLTVVNDIEEAKEVVQQKQYEWNIDKLHQSRPDKRMQNHIA